MVLAVLIIGSVIAWVQSGLSIISACYPDGLLPNGLSLVAHDYYWPWTYGMIPLLQDRGRIEHRAGGSYRTYQLSIFEHGVATVSTANLFIPETDVFWSYKGTETNPALSPPGWSIASRREQNARLLRIHPASRWTEIAAGWPLKSFKGAIREDYSPNGVSYAYEWSLPLGPRSGAGGVFDPPFIPFRPLPGLIVNAALYGTACLIPIAVFRSGHRRRRAARRTRAGLCPACAYPASGLTTCPECATAVPPRPAKRSSRTRTRPPR